MLEARNRNVQRFAVLARPELLWGSRALRDDDSVIVVALPESAAPAHANTVQVDWMPHHQVRLSARRAYSPEELGSWFAAMPEACDGLTISQELATEILTGTGCDFSGAIPACYVEVDARTAHPVFSTYSQTGYLERKSLFLRTAGPLPLDVDPVRAVLDQHHQVAPRLNNPEWAYCRAYPGQEVEVKFTFSGVISIHHEATEALRALRQGGLANFVEHPVKAFWPSDRRSRMLEIVGPGSTRGYISFTDTPDADVYIEKIKLFSEDTLVRREKVTKGVSITGADSGRFLDYALTAHGFEVSELGVFLRTRYDIDFESLITGNIFGMMFDHCVIENSPKDTLIQCEVEYLESRTLSTPDPEVIQNELYQVVEWLKKHFRLRGLNSEVGFYSKLAFMRDAQQVGDAPR